MTKERIEVDTGIFLKYFKEIEAKLKTDNSNTNQIINGLIGAIINVTSIKLQKDKNNNKVSGFFVNELLAGLHEASHLVTAIYNPFFQLDLEDVAAKIVSGNKIDGITFIAGVIENASSKDKIALSEAILISLDASVVLEQELFNTNTSATDNDKKEVQDLKMVLVQKTNKSKNAYHQITKNLVKKHRLKIFLIGLYLANYHYITKEMLFKLCKVI